MTALTPFDYGLLALCLPLALWLRTWRLKDQGHRYSDEGLYAVRALFQLELLGFIRRNLRALRHGHETLAGIFERLPHGWYARNANYQIHEWAVALAQKLSGRREWSGLLVSAAFGMLIVLCLPLAALGLGGLPAFRLALVLVTVDAVGVYYSRTAFGDTMASFFLLLAAWGVLTSPQEPLALTAAGFALGLCLMSKTQYYFVALGLEVFLTLSLAGGNDLMTWLGGLVLFNLGVALPIVGIEAYGRLLRRWGYDQRTYLELVRHQYFTITKDGDRVEADSGYRSEIPWLRWRWLQMLWQVQGPLYCALLLAAAGNVLWRGEKAGLALLLIGLIPAANWLRLQFCALRYLFAGQVLLLLLIALYLPAGGALAGHPGRFALVALAILAAGLWRLPRYFQQSGHRQALHWLRSRTERLFCTDYYNAQLYFPRACVRYAPNSIDELRMLAGRGFRYWMVDLHATYALWDAQEAVLATVQSRLAPVAEFVDEGTLQRHFWWEYCYSKIVTPKYERCFRVAPATHRTVKIYDLSELPADLRPEPTPGVTP